MENGPQQQAANRLRARLLATPWGVGFGRLTVVIEEREVRLRGCVGSFYMKQMAQALAARESPGCRVCNLLAVCPLLDGQWSAPEVSSQPTVSPSAMNTVP